MPLWTAPAFRWMMTPNLSPTSPPLKKADDARIAEARVASCVSQRALGSDLSVHGRRWYRARDGALSRS